MLFVTCFILNIPGKMVSWYSSLLWIILIHSSSRWIFKRVKYCNSRGVSWRKGGQGMTQCNWVNRGTKATKIVQSGGSSALTCQEAQNLFWYSYSDVNRFVFQDRLAPLIKYFFLRTKIPYSRAAFLLLKLWKTNSGKLKQNAQAV